MKEESPSTDTSIELAYASLAVFADDGTLDMNELKSLLDIALRDGIISDKEKDILRNIFNRVMEPKVSAEAWDRIQLVRKQHGI
jgi:hypothetical protein